MSCVHLGHVEKNLLRRCDQADRPPYALENQCSNMSSRDLYTVGTSISLHHNDAANYAADNVFRATQDMAVNDKLITSADTTIKACEAELATLQEIAGPEGFFQSLWKSRRASTERRRYLLKKMYEAQVRIQTLEKQNMDLKRILARGN